MSSKAKTWLAFGVVGLLLITIGFSQSWSVALGIFNMCLISAIVALGINIQWGYAGIANVGIMGFAALGGVCAVLISQPPVTEAWEAGRGNLILACLFFAITLALAIFCYQKMPPGRPRSLTLTTTIVIGLFLSRYFLDPAVASIEAVDSAKTGYLGGFDLPIIISWLIGGLVAAGLAWVIGKIALGLRADYLTIATLGISEIIVALMKNEDWLTRGVKNVSGLPRPVPYEIDLQTSEWFINFMQWWHSGYLSRLADVEKQEALRQFTIEGSSIFVKLCYAGLFAAVLVFILMLSIRALNSPWGRMMRAVRDNEVSAAAMGKNITRRHLQIFIIGSAIVGIAGAMITTMDGQFTPTSYRPIRFTFLFLVMVIVGGSGNNLGAVLGGFLIWIFWVEAEPVGVWLMGAVTSGMNDSNMLKIHLLEHAQHMRLFFVGMVLLLVLRFSPGGILPEVIRKRN